MTGKQKQQQKSRLGHILVKRRRITQDQLNEALVYQQAHQLRLGEALMDLKFISAQQLTSALRKQSWLRIATTCLTLSVTPFSPAFAASPGKLGTSSTASSQITLTIQPKTVNNGNANIQFNDSKVQLSSGVCTSNFDAALYRISASGSGNKGKFELTDNQQQKLNYDVSFQYHNESIEQLAEARNSRFFHNKHRAEAAASCSNADNNRLRVTLTDPENLSQRSNYAGTLTITIAAE